MKDFEEEITSIWDFEDRGNWSSHKGDYRGNCSPRAVKNLILKYSKEYDLILDQFIGSGTTAIEALLNNRRIIGYDINPNAIDIAKERTLDFKKNKRITLGDACNLSLGDSTIDMICTHPPYWNIIRYSKSIQGDISLLDNKCDYYSKMKQVAMESYRVLKPNKYCCIVIGDVRKNGFIEPVGLNILNLFLEVGFNLKEIIIKYQHNCKSTDKWIKIAKDRKFLLIKHEYILVFKKRLF